MVFAELDSSTAHWLEQRSPVLREAFSWIRALPADAPDGISELRGTAMYANVHGYETIAREECLWESHRHTVDVQICISGGEVIDWVPQKTLEPAGDYSVDKDTEHWINGQASPTILRALPGMFALFLPGELHRPKVSNGVHPSIRKLVFKIDVALFNS